MWWRRWLIGLCIGLLLGPTWAFGDAFQWDSGYKSDAPDAEDVVVKTNNFSGALSSADTNMQAALDTLDDAGTSPAGATYITQTAHAQLSAEQAIGALASGILRGATTTGVITVLTTSAGISDNISDETGGGALMFATSPTITTGITIPNAGLLVQDTDASHTLAITPGSNLTANRILTLTTGDAARTVTINADTTISGTNTGDQTITLTGDVTGSGTGSFAATVAADSVALTTDTTGSYAAGDAEAGNATGVACTDCVALTTETSGNYVASVADGSGIDVTGTAAEGWTATVNLIYTDTLAADPTMNAEEARFSTDGTGGGLLFEGSTADTIEGLLVWAPTTSDRTLTLPDASDTLVGKATTDTLTNKTLAAADNVIAADTAVALAANGGNCSAGNYPLGVDANGAVESCTAAGGTDVGGTNAARVLRTAGDVTTTSTSLVDMTGATRTLTTGANPVEVCFFGMATNNGANFNTMAVVVDGVVEGGTRGGISIDITTATANTNMSFCHQTAALTAASHTIKLQISVSGGTGTWACNTTNACNFDTVELVD